MFRVPFEKRRRRQYLRAVLPDAASRRQSEGDLEIGGKVEQNSGVRHSMRARRPPFAVPLAVAAVLTFSGAQSRADDSFTCPVTKLPDPRFVPPAPWLARDSWFGSEKLWTLLE